MSTAEEVSSDNPTCGELRKYFGRVSKPSREFHFYLT